MPPYDLHFSNFRTDFHLVHENKVFKVFEKKKSYVIELKILWTLLNCMAFHYSP